jgi:hypothetical protein
MKTKYPEVAEKLKILAEFGHSWVLPSPGSSLQDSPPLEPCIDTTASCGVDYSGCVSEWRTFLLKGSDPPPAWTTIPLDEVEPPPGELFEISGCLEDYKVDNYGELISQLVL